ncbi:MAG: hypothetical protein EBS59_04240 [Verrucomicrobia bacterium]|nr:hypothetical protein [Verrucomicrobiota bacterium]
MESSEEIALVLLLLTVIGSVAVTLALTLLHPKYRELKPRLILSTQMLGIPLAVFGGLRPASLVHLPTSGQVRLLFDCPCGRVHLRVSFLFHGHAPPTPTATLIFTQRTLRKLS